jgi:glutamine synthetase
MGLLTDYTVGIPYTTAMDGYLNGVYKASASITFIFMCTVTAYNRLVEMQTTASYTVG